MADRSPELQSLLDAFDDQFDLEEGSVDAAWASVRARTVDVPPPGGGGASALPKVVALVGGVAAAAVVMLSGGPAPSALSNTRVAPVLGAMPAVEPEPVIEVREAAESSAVDEQPPEIETPAERPRRRRRPRRVETKAPEPPSDPLAAELALMRRARSALKNGKPAGALSIAREHQRKFPEGVLGEEASATEIRALCELGRTPEAETAARRYRKSFGGASKATGLLAKCKG